MLHSTAKGVEFLPWLTATIISDWEYEWPHCPVVSEYQVPRPVNSGEEGGGVGEGAEEDVVVFVGAGAFVVGEGEGEAFVELGASVKVHTMLMRSLGEITVELGSRGAIGSIISANVVLAPSTNVISSKGTLGANSCKVSRLITWIDPKGHSSQTPTTWATVDCKVFSRFWIEIH